MAPHDKTGSQRDFVRVHVGHLIVIDGSMATPWARTGIMCDRYWTAFLMFNQFPPPRLEVLVL